MPLNTSKFWWCRTGGRVDWDLRSFLPVVFNLDRPLPTLVITVCGKLRHQSFLSREYEATLSLGKGSPKHIQRLHSVGETHHLSQCGWLNTLNTFMDLLKIVSWQHPTLPTTLNTILCCPWARLPEGGKVCRMSKSQQYSDTFLLFTSVKISTEMPLWVWAWWAERYDRESKWPAGSSWQLSGCIQCFVAMLVADGPKELSLFSSPCRSPRSPEVDADSLGWITGNYSWPSNLC